MPSSASRSAGARNNRSSVDENDTSDRFDGDPHGRRDAPAASVLVPATAAEATSDTEAAVASAAFTNSRSGGEPAAQCAAEVRG